MTRLVSPEPPLDESCLASSRSSRSLPLLKALLRGEFEVVKQLVSTLNDGAGAKNNADKIIDLNGTKKTGGTGIKQLRENIAESKLSYEIMDDAAQAFLK